MSRVVLWVLTGLSAAVAAGLALWARSTYATVEGVRYFFYGLQGYPVVRSEELAARDAAAAISTQVTMAWVFAGLALVLLLAALLRREDRPQHDAAGDGGVHAGEGLEFPGSQS